MKYRRILALALSLAMLLAVTGCYGIRESYNQLIGGSANSFTPDPYDGREPVDTGVEPKYYRSVWRNDVDFSDLEYEHYDLESLERYTDPIYKLAEKGGSAEDFKEAYYDLLNELMHLTTLKTLIDYQSYSDASDKEVQDESLYMGEVYYDAINEYQEALHVLAGSRHQKVMRELFSRDNIAYYEEHGASSEEDREKYLEEQQLQQDYRAIMAESQPDLDEAAEVFVELVELRNEIAKEAGFDSYADYAYQNIYSRNYTPEDIKSVWKGVKRYFVPLMQEYAYDVLSGVQQIYETDLDCSPEHILDTMDQVLPQLSEEVYYAFEYMLDHGLYDIELSRDKVPVGYTTSLYEYNVPFIFISPYDDFFDFGTLYHEFGHYVNFFYSEGDFLYGSSDYDLSELQSQGMEVLFTFFYDDLFGEKLGDLMRDYSLLNMVSSVVEGALYDEFQQRVYTEEDLTAERASEIFEELLEEYGYQANESNTANWLYVNHNFENPFYYISYCVSALGALELYSICQDDWDEGLDMYLTVSAMDTEEWYYDEALEEAGFQDIFDSSSHKTIARALEKGFED